MSPRWYQVRVRTERYARYIVHMLALKDPFRPPNYLPSHAHQHRNSIILGHVALTPNNTKTMGRMTCHCFQRPIRRDLTSSSYRTDYIRCLHKGLLGCVCLSFLEKHDNKNVCRAIPCSVVLLIVLEQRNSPVLKTYQNIGDRFAFCGMPVFQLSWLLCFHRKQQLHAMK